MKNKGIILDSKDFDLYIKPRRDENELITSGLQIGDITTQNQAVILYAHTGELKHATTTGVGVSDMLLDNNILSWKLKIRTQFESEGMRVNSIDFDNTLNPVIDAKYRG